MVVKAQAELFAFVASMLPFYPQDVQDIVQDINLTLFRHEVDYDSSRPFKPWFFRIARNQVLNFLKSKHRERVSFDDQAVAECAESLEEETRDTSPTPLLERLNVCLKKLSPKQRKLLDMRYSLLIPAWRIAAKQWHHGVKTERQHRALTAQHPRSLPVPRYCNIMMASKSL